jgi:hypothetical protein
MLLTLVDLAAGTGNQVWIAEVGLEGSIRSTERARAAYPSQGDDVAVIGDTETRRLDLPRLLVHFCVGDKTGPTRPNQGPQETTRFSQPVQFSGKLTSNDQLPTPLHHPVDDRRKIRLRRAPEHSRGEIGVHDHAHELRSPGAAVLLPG